MNTTVTPQLTEGAKAPLFTLPTDSDGTFSLAQHLGKAVVIYFYPKDNTPGCTKESIAFNELKAEFDALGITILGISPDEARKHDKFKAKYELEFTLGADTEHKTAEAYGVWVEKNMYGKKFWGIERSTFLIDKDGNIAKLWRKVKVAGHAEAVLEAARVL
nr:thioredoxin-dependent thiol peroxidase [Pseudovibrio hongkongensis]